MITSCTIASAISKFDHDPDSIDEFYLPVTDDQKHGFPLLRARLFALRDQRRADAERANREARAAEIPADPAADETPVPESDSESQTEETPVPKRRRPRV